MDLNNNQILLLAVAAVALYFFMKYRECSKQENFGQLNITDHNNWLKAYINEIHNCALPLHQKNCKKTKKGFDSEWNNCKLNQTNNCINVNERECSAHSSNYKDYKAYNIRDPRPYWKKQMNVYCDKLKSSKCHPKHTDGDCK